MLIFNRDPKAAKLAFEYRVIRHRVNRKTMVAGVVADALFC